MTTTDTPRREQVALNADVVDYTRHLADDYDATTATVEKYRQMVTEEIDAVDGTLLNFVGDNFMAVFGDPKDAVQTAIAIASSVEEANTDVPSMRQVRFRMGMDEGEIGISGGHYFGDALNVASRIQGMARPGGLSISGRVYRALDEPALRFRSLGKHRLKGVPEEIDVFEFTDLPRDGTAHFDRRALALESPTVAVLPIHTEGADPSVASMAGLVRSDLIHRLSQVPELKVIDAKEDSGGRPATAVARYMLETGTHQFGDRLRVWATLFDVTTMNVVKSHKWSVPVPDLFELSDELAEEVARSISVELILGEPAGLYWELDDAEAVDRVAQGWFHLRTGTREGWIRAVGFFGQVAESHPDRPYGYVLSAFANWTGASNEWAPDPSKTFALAREQARRGLEIGDPTGMAQAVEAAILMSEGREDEALALVDRIEITRPTCDVTFGLQGSVRRYMGQWEQAVDLLDTAMRLTGLNKPWYPTVKACSLFMGQRFEQAASVAETVLEYQPHNLEALLVLAAAQVELGMDRRARATGELIKERFPAVDVEAWLDRNPYQVEDLLERWKADLASAGALSN